MPRAKKCAICGEAITDGGRKYCAECRNWEREANKKAATFGECDHVIGLHEDAARGYSLAYLSKHDKDASVSYPFGYCPICGEFIRDEKGGLIVGEAWESGES